MLKSKISKIIGVDVEKNGWSEAFRQADARSTINTTKVLAEICKMLEPHISEVITKPQSVNEKVAVYNPMPKDFTCRFDVYRNGSSVDIKIPAGEMVKLDAIVASHVKSHLIKEIHFTRNGAKVLTEEDILKIDAEISAPTNAEL